MSDRAAGDYATDDFVTADSTTPQKVGERGQPIEYEDGTSAAIVNTEHGVIVEVREPKRSFKVTGFPTPQDAYNFLMWADLHGEDGDILPAQHYQDQLRWFYR